MTPEETRTLMEVASRLGRVEQGLADIKKELLDNGQPGFISKTRQRLEKLERSEARRGWIEHSWSALVAAVVALLIAAHDHWFPWFHTK